MTLQSIRLKYHVHNLGTAISLNLFHFQNNRLNKFQVKIKPVKLQVAIKESIKCISMHLILSLIVFCSRHKNRLILEFSMTLINSYINR